MEEHTENAEQNARQQLLYTIVEKELAMFLSTPNEGGPASCQQRPDTFRLMRAMAHSVHENDTLLSYLHDLEQAESQGRNFMIEKYARMDERIPPVSTNPLIPVIAEAEAHWMQEASARYPRSLQSSGMEIFRRYIACELETLSDQTLELYMEEVKEALAEQRNMVEERHDFLCKKLGFASLADREHTLDK